MKVFFITGNKTKFLEAQHIVAGTGIELVQKDLPLIEIKSTSQELVVANKALQAWKKLKKPCIVDDTGIYFDEYDNFPGTITRYLVSLIGIKGILRLLKGGSRTAHFTTMLCIASNKEFKVVSGSWRGRIATKASKKVNPDMGYDSIFIPNGFKKPLSEIPIEVKAKHSHRRQAFQKLLPYLRSGTWR